MNSTSKSVYIEKQMIQLATTSQLKIKPVYAKSNLFINSSKELNNKDPKFKIGDIVRISKHKKYFCKR